MATFGIEGIRHFPHARAAGIDVADLTYVFNNCNGMDSALRAAGHTRAFYWADTDCWEIDLNDKTKGGIDNQYADNVDLMFISTHGNHWSGHAVLAYDSAENNFLGDSHNWLLGDDWNLEWLMMYACETLNRDSPLDYWDVFQRLHKICGAYDLMWDGWTVDECGEDTGHNMTDGKTVAESWIDGVSDWWVDNHPMVLAIERESTWKNGALDWANTTMSRDHLWGHGVTVADIGPTEKYWMSWRWAEG